MRTMIEDIRSFNRLYLRMIGILDRSSTTGLSLAEQRVLLEIGKRGAASAAEIERRLGFAAAHVGRVLARLRQAGFLDVANGSDLCGQMTPAGEAAVATLDARIDADIEQLVGALGESKARHLSRSLAAATSLLDGATPPLPNVTLREPRAGDLSFVAHRMAVMGARDYGFDASAEELILEIIGRFVSERDPMARVWIAELDGEVAGSIMLMRGDEPGAAKLRLYYVEPGMRGHGIGSRLVQACVAEARALGYRRLLLWTTAAMVSARRIFEAAGFTLTTQDRHPSFGREIDAQIWSLDLAAERPQDLPGATTASPPADGASATSPAGATGASITAAPGSAS